MRKILPCLGLLLLTGVTAQALSLSDVENRVRLNVRDTATDTSLQRYSDTIIDRIINDGQRDVVNQTWCLDKTTADNLVVGTTFYQLPTDLIAIKFVYYRDTSSNTLELQEKNERSFRQSNPDWQKQTGKPVNYFVRTSTHSNTTYEYAVYPIPSTSSQLGTITIDYYSQSTDMSNDSDIPFDSLSAMVPYHDALVNYATARIKIIEGKMDEANIYIQMYNSDLQNINSKFGARPNWNPSFSGATK